MSKYFIVSLCVIFLACASPEPEIVTIVVTATPIPPTVTPTSTLVPTLTATSVPTSTPIPTNTPTPTFTPTPTPPPTLTPTNTPRPTYTFRPTRTPILPTRTRRPLPTYTASPTITPTPSSVLEQRGITCDDQAFLAELIRISQRNDVSILKFYRAEKIRQNKSHLDCLGEARLSVSEDQNDLFDVLFYAEVDYEGDVFIGYEWFDRRGVSLILSSSNERAVRLRDGAIAPLPATITWLPTIIRSTSNSGFPVSLGTKLTVQQNVTVAIQEVTFDNFLITNVIIENLNDQPVDLELLNDLVLVHDGHVPGSGGGINKSDCGTRSTRINTSQALSPSESLTGDICFRVSEQEIDSLVMHYAKIDGAVASYLYWGLK